jgi:hypothetical protein
MECLLSLGTRDDGSTEAVFTLPLVNRDTVIFRFRTQEFELSASSCLLLGRHAGQEVTVRMDDGTQVQGHISRIRFEDITGSDTKDQAGRIRFEKTDPAGDDTEGHSFKRIELEIDDGLAKLLRAASDRGEPVYVRFSDENDVQTHIYRVKL